MSSIKQNLTSIHARIHAAELAAGRPTGSVQLVAVSKTKPASDLVQAYQAGQRHFGENYVQEALEKQAQLNAYAMIWHFIGPIQSNKTRQIATAFDWVHSVDRFKIAQRLNEQRPDNLPPLNICVQVNISRETTKSGIMLEELSDWVSVMQTLPRLRWRGVMAIPEPEHDFEKQRLPFRRLYEAVSALKQPTLDTFSMGMSDDLEAAIFEGATMVRIGTAIFGQRDYSATLN